MNRPIIVAEIGASHGQNLEHAEALVYAAKCAGADAVKFQTYKPETIAANVMIEKGPWAGKTYHELYAEAMLPWEWFPALFKKARGLGLTPFSSPFCEDAVAFLEKLDCPWYKIASPELTHLPLIEEVCKTGKPVIFSVNRAANAEDISDAVGVARYYGVEVTLLLCMSDYPASPTQYHLRKLDEWREMFNCRVGISDHTQDYVLPIAATARGVDMIERHITLSVDDKHPDACFATPPERFREMTEQIYLAAGLLRDADHLETDPHRRCVWVVKPISAGERITRENVAVLRPYREGAILPCCFPDLTRSRAYANRDLLPNCVLRRDDVRRGFIPLLEPNCVLRRDDVRY